MKFQGTILGKPGDTGDLEIEGGGELKSVHDWVRKNGGWVPPEEELSPATLNGISDDRDESTPSSGLSSIGDGLDKIGPPDREVAVKLESVDQPNGGLVKKSGSEETGSAKEAIKAAGDAMDLT